MGAYNASKQVAATKRLLAQEAEGISLPGLRAAFDTKLGEDAAGRNHLVEHQKNNGPQRVGGAYRPSTNDLQPESSEREGGRMSDAKRLPWVVQ